MGLINVDDALSQILSGIETLSVEVVPIDRALERILAEDVRADQDIPPFANSSMDGYAVRATDVAAATPEHPVSLEVVADILAGTDPQRPVQYMQAARIMTGAPLPPGADAVVPVENTDDDWRSDGRAPLPNQIAIRKAGTRPGENVRMAGEDIAAGQVVLRRDTMLRPQDVGVLVSLGYDSVHAIRRPRVVIIATGDELVDAGQTVGPGQIRNSNSYMLAGLVETYGANPIRLPIARDSVDAVRECFQIALSHEPDLIISSAGVSVGTHDVVREVVSGLGTITLWRINLRPGKPLAYGHVHGVPFLGLPGNPVSAMVTFEVFVRPILMLMGGRPDRAQHITAVVGEPIESDGRRTYMRVTLRKQGSDWAAYSTGTQSSGALMSLVLADGLLIIPEGMMHVDAGTRLPVRLLRSDFATADAAADTGTL